MNNGLPTRNQLRLLLGALWVALAGIAAVVLWQLLEGNRDHNIVILPAALYSFAIVGGAAAFGVGYAMMRAYLESRRQ